MITIRFFRITALLSLLFIGTFAGQSAETPNLPKEGTKQDKWVAPDWSLLKIIPKPRENSNVIVFQNEKAGLEAGYATFYGRIHMTPREKTSELTAQIEPDGLVFNTPKIEGTGERCAQIQFFGFDPKRMANEDYSLYVTATGPKSGKANLYFEGHFEDGRHYWKRLEVTMNGTRQTFAFDQTVPEGLRDLYFRFDFFTPGKYWLHAVRLERETDESDGVAPTPETIFHLSMNGTTTPDVAAGDKTPKRSENVEFVEGLDGQAARFTAKNKARLEFNLAKNLRPETGAISVWIRPDWSVENGPKLWRTILSMPWDFPTRVGSGAVWFWIYEGKVRGDTSDLRDHYDIAPIAQTPGWRHVVFSWDHYEHRLYIDGKRFGGGRIGEADAVHPQRPFRYAPLDFSSFSIGRYNDWPLEGDLDELTIYSGPLSEDAVRTLYRRYRPDRPVSFEVATPYRFDDDKTPLLARVKNDSSDPQTVELTLADSLGAAVRTQTETAAAKKTTEFSLEPLQSLSPGNYALTLTYRGEIVESVPLIVFDSRQFAAKKPLETSKTGTGDSLDVWDRELPRKEKETINPLQIDPSRIVFYGKPSEGACDGRRYLEMNANAGDRFAVHLESLEAQKLYCFEWDFPDDKKRSVDIIAQPSHQPAGNHYGLQTGYLTGDEYPNGGKILTQRALYWAEDSDVSLVFMTARSTGSPESDNAEGVVAGGAAVAEIRVYEVTGDLPIAQIHEAEKRGGQRREVGIYFEDPAINYDFAADGSKADEFPTMIKRLDDYMNFTGQNFLAYPLVWYDGTIGPIYQPRPHLPRFAEAFLTVFDRTGRDFMATINQNNIPFAPPRVTRTTLQNGSLNDSIFSIQSSGTLHPGGWHGSPPVYNPLHPDAQKMMIEEIDEILAHCAAHPSFKGIILHLPRHVIWWFGDIRSGYNDYLTRRFEKEMGIVVPVATDAPNAARLRAEWILANKRAEWIDWRCRVLADWFKTLANRITAVRSDLTLGINCMIPILYEPTPEDGTDGEFWTRANREAGIDPIYYADSPNIFLEQTIFPADYRWMENRSKPEIRARLRKTEETPGMYGSLSTKNDAWIQQHDRYWESPIGDKSRNGGKSLEAPWLREHSWRVSTLNPTGFEAMRHYLLPLRFHDIQGITKGGFLIGTYGMERELANFAAAFRALPAERFGDVAGSTEEVKIRSFAEDGTVWFYVANTGEKPITATFSGLTGSVVDLVRGVSEPPTDGNWTITLSPMTLRSFQTTAVPLTAKVQDIPMPR